MRTASRTAFVSLAALVLAACAHEREFRVAYVGSEGSAQIAGDDDTGEAGRHSPPVVAAGNALLGPPSGFTGVGGNQPGNSGGTVTTILPSTNQTLVQLTNGTVVLLNGVGGSTPLVGTTVANTTNTVGQLAKVPLGTTGTLLGPVTGTSAVTNVTGPATTTVTNILTQPLLGGCC